MTDDEYCNECKGYGDDYYTNEDGEQEQFCPLCPFRREESDG